MNRNYIFNTINDALPALLHDVMVEGDEVGSRAGRTMELTHVGITLREPWRREILLPIRKANIAAQIAETAWILAGRNDLEFLSRYLPRAADFSDDGKTWRAGYGPRLRAWPTLPGHTEPIDQFRTVFEILRKSPASRQAVMSIWDPALDYQASKDIPCNNWLSWSSRLGRLDLMVAIRSNDLMWGWSGINAFEWSALQEVMAGLLGLEVGGLHFATTSLHLYDQHWAKAEKIREHCSVALPTTPAASPRFRLGSGVGPSLRLDLFDDYLRQWFEVEEIIRSGQEASHLIESFPEPMLQSWLRVLAWWWTGEREYRAALEGTALDLACEVAVQPNRETPATEDVVLTGRIISTEDMVLTGRIIAGGKVLRPEGLMTPFMSELCDLHLAKEKAYGGSWKKRGELFSIIPNIARKVDRIQGGETDDETSADTAGDLFVYLAKYRTFLDDLREFQGQPAPERGKSSDQAASANALMVATEEACRWPWSEDLDSIRTRLCDAAENLFTMVETGKSTMSKKSVVDGMLPYAYVYARTLWQREQDEKPGGANNPLCKFCHSAKSNHVPGGSRWTCQAQDGFQPVEDEEDEYRGADAD